MCYTYEQCEVQEIAYLKEQDNCVCHAKHITCYILGKVGPSFVIFLQRIQDLILFARLL